MICTGRGVTNFHGVWITRKLFLIHENTEVIGKNYYIVTNNEHSISLNLIHESNFKPT